MTVQDAGACYLSFFLCRSRLRLFFSLCFFIFFNFRFLPHGIWYISFHEFKYYTVLKMIVKTFDIHAIAQRNSIITGEAYQGEKRCGLY